MVNRSFKYEFEKCSVALALNRGPGYGRWDWSPSELHVSWPERLVIKKKRV